MKDFKPLKNLEDLREVNVGDIVGMRQYRTISALCVSRGDERIQLLGDMGSIVVKYNLLVNDVNGFYGDGSIQRDNNQKDMEVFIQGDKEYKPLKKQLIDAGIWEEKK